MARFQARCLLAEPFGRLAATDRIDCCDSCMFCFVVCLFYEERSTVKVNNMPILNVPMNRKLLLIGTFTNWHFSLFIFMLI